MLQITLRHDDGVDKNYVQEFISGRAFRRAVELQGELKEGITPEKLDMLVVYVTSIFGNQFTTDEFYDGIAAHKLVPTIVEIIRTVTGSAAKAIGSDGIADPN